MNKKNSQRGRKNSKVVCPQISKQCLANYAGLDEKKIALVIIEAIDDGECEMFPAVCGVLR